MAPSPALTGAQREALRTQIAAKRASQVQADRAARAAKDKANIAAGVGKGVPPRKSKTPEYPAQKVRVGKTTVRTKTKVPTTVVQGAPDTERQRKRAAGRPSRAATPQAEKPKNPNYKSPVKDPNSKAKTAGMNGRLRDKARARGTAAPAGSLSTQQPKKSTVDGLTMRGPFKSPNPLGPGSKGGIKTNSQPGQGATGTGTGRDNPEAGKDRSEFEKQRQRERGTGKDRPPVYKPEDDGQRGGYVNRSKPIPPIPGTSKRPIPGKSTFTGTPGYSAGGSSVVRGLTPR